VWHGRASGAINQATKEFATPHGWKEIFHSIAVPPSC
jgi:hypothetical protein